MTFARIVPLPENRLALAAVQRVALDLGSDEHNPLFLHGPTGTGKTYLSTAILDQATHPMGDGQIIAATAWTREAGDCDLLVIEDVQHLPSRSAEALAGLLDERRAQRLQTVVTANVGPGELPFPARLRSRLAAGLVVGLLPFPAASRRVLLEQGAQRRRLALAPEVLTWLAENLVGGGRQLEGALAQVEALARLTPGPLDVETVAAHFHEPADAVRPTVERIASRVGGYFQVDPRQLKSRRRYRNVLLPRQVSMYLARQLTGLTLEEIGSFFGGRDHSTVLHACRKVEEALAHDTDLSGTLRRLHADLA